MNETTNQGIKTSLDNITILYAASDIDENTTKILNTKIKELIILNQENYYEEYLKVKHKVDIVLADITTKDCFSFSLMKEIRASNDWETPILLISDLKDNSMLCDIIKLKIENLILKPFYEGTFLKIVGEIFSKLQQNRVIEYQREHLEQFKMLLDTLNIVTESNLKGEMIYVNQLFCDITGYTKEELIGQPYKILRHPDTSSDVYKRIWENLQNGKSWKGKLKNNTKNGEPYYVKLIIMPVKNSKGEIYKYMSSGFSISDTEEEKQNLKRFILNQKLDQLNTRKTTQEEINNKARDLVLKAKQDAFEKEEKLVRYVREMDEELRRLRVLRETDKKQIAFLEKQYREFIETTDTEKKIFQERLEKVLTAGRKSYEKSTFLKKKCDVLTAKIKRSQDGIKVLQEYVDDYRKTIDDLQDVIKTHERTIENLKRGSSSSTF